MSVLSPRLGIQVSSVYPTYIHIKGQCPLCVCVCVCSQASRSRATLSCDSSYYTPGIYAEGYIVFVFLFVCSFVHLFVRSFVLPSVTWNLRQSFALKFLKCCISQQLLIRKHSYLDHSYPGGLAFTPWPRPQGPCPGVGLEVKI